MLKKLIFFCLCLLANNMYAQVLSPLQEPHITNKNFQATLDYVQKLEGTKKRSFQRWYNHVTTLNAYNISKNKPTFLVDSLRATATLWEDSTLYGTYLSSNGLSYRKVQFKAFGNTFDPYAAIYNDPALFPTELKLNTSNGYKLDSFAIIGNYINVKPNVVDTLIISMVYGSGADSTDNKLFYYGPTSTVAPNFSVDTLRYVCGKFNFTSFTLNGLTKVVQKIYLNAATMYDTIPGGFNRFVVPIGLNIPAFRIPSTSISFKSGETWIPNDTLSKYNRLRLYSYKEKYGAYGTYFKYNYNSSQMVYNQSDYWNIHPWPSFAFDNNYQFEQHWCSYLVSASVTGVNTYNSPTAIQLYPNPTSHSINLNIDQSITTDKVDVQIFSSLGQLILESHVTPATPIDISDLPNGQYSIIVHNENLRWNSKFVKQ